MAGERVGPAGAAGCEGGLGVAKVVDQVFVELLVIVVGLRARDVGHEM